MQPLGLTVKDNEAYLNGHKITDLAKEYKTPLYVMDETTIKNAITTYQENMKSDKYRFDLVYASKAFLTLEFAKYIDALQLHIDAVSLGDLYVIQKSGMSLNKVVFHGNNKSNEEIEFAIKNNIGYLVIDNMNELEKVITISNKLQKAVTCLIRVNPGIDAHTHKYIQTALFTSKFGESIYDKPRIDEMLKLVKSSKYVNLCGFHAHIGSQIHETAAFQLEVEKMIDFQNEINQEYKLHLQTLNLGGGFGIKYEKDERNLSIEEMSSSLKKYIEEKLVDSNSEINHIMIEPGRSIVGRAGITLYTCSYIKQTFGKKNYVFIDGGMTDNIRPALYGATYECDIANKMNAPKEVLVDVAGKCCESGDIIRKDVLIPNVESGDIMLVYATGAYNYSMFSNYNNMLKPAVILVGSNVKVISRRETLEDLCELF